MHHQNIAPQDAAQVDMRVNQRPSGADVSVEWLSVMTDASQRGLIDPAAAHQAEAHFAIGLLTDDGLREAVCQLLASGPAADAALDAIAPAFASGDVIELRSLNPVGGGGVSLCGRLGEPTERSALSAFVRQHLGRRNIYVGANPRRASMAGATQAASAADVELRCNVVLDFDLKDAPDVDPDWTATLDALRAAMDPTLVVNSGNGFHVWCAVEPVSGPDVEATTARLAAAMARIGADNMADPARIVRLPFTVNLPTATKRARGAVVRLAVTC